MCDPVAFAHIHAPIRDQEEKKWQLLLEIPSLKEVGFMWWDAGLLHFLIDQEDLINKQFDFVYAGIETL
jgi:uncharacterized protein YwqG